MKTVKAKFLNEKMIPIEDLGIPKLTTNLKIIDLMNYLNFNIKNEATSSNYKVLIIGYNDNFNFYIGDKINDEELELTHPDIKKVNNLFYVPNIPENLDVNDQNNLHFEKKPIIIEYTLNLLPHRNLNTVAKDKSWPNIIAPINSLVPNEIKKNYLEFYRYLIQTDKSLGYTYQKNIFQSETISFLKSELEDINTYFDIEKNIIAAQINQPFQIQKGNTVTHYQVSMPESLSKFIILKAIHIISPNTNLTVLNYGIELNTTINGDVCQNWNSHQVHHENNSFWDHFRKVPKFLEGGKGLADMSVDEKNYIKDGLVKADNNNGVVKFVSHNKCRNPGNRMSAPWCYTKNPKKRWDYCVKPDHRHKMAKYVLLITTVLFIILSYTTVKIIFKKEYFTDFIARLTGGTVSSGGTMGSVTPSR